MSHRDLTKPPFYNEKDSTTWSELHTIRQNKFK